VLLLVILRRRSHFRSCRDADRRIPVFTLCC
jgi:hypothetical protein